MKKMTIQEINRLSELLNSSDPEMNDLGLTACDELFTNTYYEGFPHLKRLNCAKSILASKAYVLGLQTGKDFLESQKLRDGKRTS